jgi:hypothetical protein
MLGEAQTYTVEFEIRPRRNSKGEVVSYTASDESGRAFAGGNHPTEDHGPRSLRGVLMDIAEHVVNKIDALYHAPPPPPAPAEDAWALWAHLASEHACIVEPTGTFDNFRADLIAAHEHEHDGPGTIRNHPRESRVFSRKKMGAVLSESEE